MVGEVWADCIIGRRRAKLGKVKKRKLRLDQEKKSGVVDEDVSVWTPSQPTPGLSGVVSGLRVQEDKEEVMKVRRIKVIKVLSYEDSRKKSDFGRISSAPGQRRLIP